MQPDKVHSRSRKAKSRRLRKPFEYIGTTTPFSTA